MASASEVESCCSFAADTREKPYRSGFTIHLVDLHRGNSEGTELGPSPVENPQSFGEP